MQLQTIALFGLGKRTTVQNAFPLLFAGEHALSTLGTQIEPWTDTVRDLILIAWKAIYDLVAKEAESCFHTHEWVENDGARFKDGEKVKWAMGSVLRSVKRLLLYRCISSVFYFLLVHCSSNASYRLQSHLRPHPTKVNALHPSATSHICVQQTRPELLKWIGRRWQARKRF